MQITAMENGGKLYRYDQAPRQIDGGAEDTTTTACRFKRCKNRFETVYPEPGESRLSVCPECQDRYEQSYGDY